MQSSWNGDGLNLTWSKKEKNMTVAQWFKIIFLDKSNIYVSLEIQVPESEGIVKRTRIQTAEIHCKVWIVMWSYEAVIIRLCWSTGLPVVNAAVDLEHFILPAADKTPWRCRFHFSAELSTSAHCQRTNICFNEGRIKAASKLIWLEAHRDSMGYFK